MNKLKIIFAGTNHFSAAHLSALIKKKYKIIGVLTQPDKPSGRGQKKIFSEVKTLSIKNNIPIIQPDELRNIQVQHKILQYNADIMIVVSYGKIIPKEILMMFPKGCINVHPSLLPRWRGPTPIQSAILFNDKKTGISIIKMNHKIDSGNIIHTLECNISSTDTTKTLSLKLIPIGIRGLIESLKKISKNTVFEIKQIEKDATLSKKINKQDALLNWNMNASFLERSIRAFNPWPICYFIINKITIRVWKATIIKTSKSNNKLYNNATIGKIICYNKNGIQIQTKNHILNIQKIQFPGRKVIHVNTIASDKKNFFLKNNI